ncbi:hypothetical protein B5M42_019880 [Paenibacillus athensensis]|uniref:Uncharacterized protein n=1 Tax=Paenibacillus athensensis TaxID=1967502 RepID=A0A4Y8Q216_9BACL|nr:hypothetical protein [Paenibacillus athensensis]MCD1261068.1 hypothetical protein [Paenibacillus athensensis]
MKNGFYLYVSLLLIVVLYGMLEFTAIEFYVYGDGERLPRELSFAGKLCVGVIPLVFFGMLIPVYGLFRKFSLRQTVYAFIFSFCMVEVWTILSFRWV